MNEIAKFIGSNVGPAYKTFKAGAFLRTTKMSTTGNPNPGNFANRPREEVSAIGSKGGSKDVNPGNFANRPREQVSEIGHKGGSKDVNPGNFANRPKEEVREIASKGGRAGGRARKGDRDE